MLHIELDRPPLVKLNGGDLNVNVQMAIDAVINVAYGLIGEKEVGQNRGKKIDEIQQSMGYLGVAYCALTAQFCWNKIIRGHDHPLPNTASSQTLFHWAKELGLVYTDPKLIHPGDIVIWQKWKLWQGHAGLVVSSLMTTEELTVTVRGNTITQPVDSEPYFLTIEGNTSDSDYGSQSAGDGIYKRKRYARKIEFVQDSFYLKGFIDMTKWLKSGESWWGIA